MSGTAPPVNYGAPQAYKQTLVPGHVYSGNKPTPAQTRASAPSPAVAARGNQQINDVKKQELRVGNQMKNAMVGAANGALINAEKARLATLRVEELNIKAALLKAQIQNNQALVNELRGLTPPGESAEKRGEGEAHAS